jgi:glutaredoxin
MVSSASSLNVLRPAVVDAVCRALRQLLMALMVAFTYGTADAANTAEDISLEVFVRDGCPHCQDAKAYLAQLSHSRPGLRIIYRSIDADPAARADLERWTRAAGQWPPGVPTFVAGARVLVGFGDAGQSGPLLNALLDAQAAPGVVVASGDMTQVEAPLFGMLSVERLGFPLFTLALGLLDGFNACAMWVLLVLLALLINLHDRRRMAMIAGTFVLVSGAVYYAFMAAWLNVFLIVGFSDPLRWALAVLAAFVGLVALKDFFAPGHGVSLSIPESAKPGLYARMRNVLRAPALGGSLLAVAALALVVNFIELLCTAGLPAVYTAVLAQQGLQPAAHYAYLALYIAGYMADDSLMVTVAVFTLGNYRLTERAGGALKLVSGTVMLVLAALLLLRPGWLM